MSAPIIVDFSFKRALTLEKILQFVSFKSVLSKYMYTSGVKIITLVYVIWRLFKQRRQNSYLESTFVLDLVIQ